MTKELACHEGTDAMSRERVSLFDTTLRDGAQTTGVDFSLDDKKQIAACSTRSASITSKAAIPAPIRWTPNSSQTKRTRNAPVRGLRHDQARGALRRQRSRRRRVARQRRRHHRLRRQGLGLSGPCRARLHAGGESRRHRRQREGGGRGAAAKSSSIASISSTATRTIPITRWPAPKPPTRPARAGSCCATPTAARCRTRSRPSCARSRSACPATISASTPITTPNRRSPIRFAALRGGARQIHGALNGLGERCGNANLCSIIPTLLLKKEWPTNTRSASRWTVCAA